MAALKALNQCYSLLGKDYRLLKVTFFLLASYLIIDIFYTFCVLKPTYSSKEEGRHCRFSSNHNVSASTNWHRCFKIPRIHGTRCIFQRIHVVQNEQLELGRQQVRGRQEGVRRYIKSEVNWGLWIWVLLVQKWNISGSRFYEFYSGEGIKPIPCLL